LVTVFLGRQVEVQRIPFGHAKNFGARVRVIVVLTVLVRMYPPISDGSYVDLESPKNLLREQRSEGGLLKLIEWRETVRGAVHCPPSVCPADAASQASTSTRRKRRPMPRRRTGSLLA